MRCADVNVLVYAHRPESPDHDGFRAWLDAARRGPEPLGVPGAVLSGFLRSVTHPKVFKDPTPLEVAVAFAEAVRASPAYRATDPGDRHWPIFLELATATGATGNRLPDAWLAAIAVEHGATWITADRGFTSYPGLRCEHPLDP